MSNPARQRQPEPGAASLAVEALRSALGERLVAVVLFGSRARGDARETTDWDLLVIAEGLPERLFERHLHVAQLMPSRCPAAVSILARTPHEFEDHLPSFYLDVALDGRILYDPRGYATKRLAMLRRPIDRMGLYLPSAPGSLALLYTSKATTAMRIAGERHGRSSTKRMPGRR